MKLFNTLMAKIFNHSSAAPAGSSSAPAPQSQQTTTDPGSAGAGSQAMGSAPAAGGSSSSGGAPAPVDVNAVLNEMASKNSEHLDWKKSIVDLMKLVGMDSSLSARKELATELGYSGDQNDSATMNVWLHKQVLKKLAENGGKVPQDLLD